MVNFIMKKEDLKDYIKAKFLFSINSKLMFMLVIIPFIIYFLCIGILVDKEALLFAFPLLGIFICLAILIFASYKIIKRSIISSFYKVVKSDIITYRFSKEKDLFELICLNNDDKFNFKISEINKIKKYKKIILLKLYSEKIITLPNIKEIENLITSNRVW